MIMPSSQANARIVRNTIEKDLNNGRARYKYYLRRAKRVTGNPDDAEDLVSRFYEKAIQNADKYDERYKLSTWLGTIFKNLCIDFIRKKAKTKEVLEKYGKDASKLASAEEPYSILIRREEQERVMKAVAELPLDKRAILIMYYFDRKTYRETAKALGLNESTARMMAGSALKEIKQSENLAEMVL